MDQLKIFNFENQDLRVIKIENESWFVGKDVASVLGYNEPHKAIARHVDLDDGMKYPITDSLGRTQEMLLINESGLYGLILSSKLESAKRFKRWVTSEVLPSIRKHGAYMTPETIDNIISDPDFGIKLLTTLKEEKEKRIQAEHIAHQANLTIELQRPKVVYAEAVEVSEDTVLVKDLAATLTQKGVSIGEKRLFVWLRENGYLCKQKGEMWNMPTQRSLDLGVIVVKHGLRTGTGGEMRKTRTSKITGKGQIYFINKFLKEKYKGA